MKYNFLLAILLILSAGCDTSRMKEIPLDRFIGHWKLVDRGILDGIEIEVTEKDGKLSGVITKLNSNKYVLLFAEMGDIIVSDIERKSNFEFTINEKKIAAPLFSSYGQATGTSLSAVFESNDKILLGNKGSEGEYARIKGN